MTPSALKVPIARIEVHYFFSDESHSINAAIRNKCELNLLGIFKEISSVLGARLSVETEAYAQGGLREYYLLKGKSEFIRTFAASVFKYVLPLEVDIEKIVSEEDKDTNRERIEKLRRDLREFEKDETHKIDFANAEALFSSNLKILKLKSNYYRHLSNAEKVTKASIHLLNAAGEETVRHAAINRKQFNTYMLVADTLKPETDESAVIEIVSPVLKTGSYKWKGYYIQTGRIISFTMKDDAFKNEVINTGMMFKNGTRIICELESTRKMNEFGETVVTGYSVLRVSSKVDEQAVVEMPKPKASKQKKEPVIQQLDLFG